MDISAYTGYRVLLWLKQVIPKNVWNRFEKISQELNNSQILRKKKLPKLEMKISLNEKKNKHFFAHVSEHCASLGITKKIWPLLEGVVCMSFFETSQTKQVPSLSLLTRVWGSVISPIARCLAIQQLISSIIEPSNESHKNQDIE